MAQVKKKVVFPKRGDVYLVNFDPTIGSEIKKTRPAVIIQNDLANRYSSTVIVVAISSQFDEMLYPTEVRITPPEGGMIKNSVILANQIRSIDKQRLGKRLGKVNEET